MTSTGEMTESDVAYIDHGETLRQAGHRMRQLGVVALPVCGEDGTFQGIITRAMLDEAIAAGGDPKTVSVGEVASMRWSPPAAVRQAGRVSGARVRRNERVVPVAGDCWRSWEETGGGAARYAIEQRIAELADAVRAAAEAVSRLSAVHECA